MDVLLIVVIDFHHGERVCFLLFYRGVLMNSGAVVAGVLLLPDNRANIVTSVDGYGRKDRASTVLIPALASSWSGDKNEP